MATRIVNSFGDHEESVERSAAHLGTSAIRRAVFSEVYGRGSRGKTSQQIIQALPQFTAQVVRNEISKLKAHGLFLTEGTGSQTRYVKEQFITANKAAILKFADNKKARNAIPTKRRPQLPRSVSAKVQVRSFDRTSTKGRGSQKSKLKVVYLTATPSSQDQLRADAEVAMVVSEVRGSKYRDKIEIITRPAATPQSLLDALNDFAPQVVHFSGHGGRGGVWFDDGLVENSRGGDVSFELLGEALDSIDKPPVLLVLNACDTLDGADILLNYVSVVIGMSDSISDLGAAIFATHFYGAIASGQSLAASIKQAVVSMKIATLVDDAKLPTMIKRDDVDPRVLRLVK